MKFIVKISYYEFEFEDGAEALAFAQTAKETIVSEDKDVAIVLVKTKGLPIEIVETDVKEG